MLTLLRTRRDNFQWVGWKSCERCTCENQTQRWQPTIQPADSKKSASSSFTEGERWTPEDGRNGHHRSDTRANRLVHRYCDSTKERRWGADLHWLQKAERCDQEWKICLTDSWRHPSQTEGIHHLYQVGCHEWILANSTGRWICQTHYIHQSIWPILLPQIATGHYVCTRDFPAHHGRDHCRRGACCMFLRWHPGVQWKRRSSRKTFEEPWKNWPSWTKRSVSFVSRRFTFGALSSTKMAWKQTQGKLRQSSKCLTPQTLPSYAVFSVWSTT